MTALPTLRLCLLTSLLWASPCFAQQTPPEPYPSSVVGTDFDFVVEGDPSAFKALAFKGQSACEMPDKRKDDAPLLRQAFAFVASFSDGTSVHMAIDAGFKTKAAARAEALRYTPRLGKLPTALRRGVERVVVHKGGESTTAFSDQGLIVVYSDNATQRIATHDLEETIFHESVHAAWDGVHARSPAWIAAQKKDGGFVTRYARKKPTREDLAESALFAFTLLHHPQRIPAAEARKIRKAIPARIAFVKALLPPGKPLTYAVKADYKRRVREEHRAAQAQQRGARDEPAAGEKRAPKAGEARPPRPKAGALPRGCRLATQDVTTATGVKDILSNALVLGLKQDEAEVNSALDAADKTQSAAELIQAIAQALRLEVADVRAQVRAYLHCNCKHAAAKAGE